MKSAMGDRSAGLANFKILPDKLSVPVAFFTCNLSIYLDTLLSSIYEKVNGSVCLKFYLILQILGWLFSSNVTPLPMPSATFTKKLLKISFTSL